MTNVGLNKNETKGKTYCTSPPRRYSFNTINCSTTKSGEFVFDLVRVKTTT